MNRNKIKNNIKHLIRRDSNQLDAENCGNRIGSEDGVDVYNITIK